jgi:hypothetical protein
MTNAEKAARLEEMAKWKDFQGAHWKERSNAAYQSHPREKEAAMSFAEAAFAAAALLREAAGMMRERGKVQWVEVAGSNSQQTTCYRGWILEVDESRGWWGWSAEAANFCYGSDAPTLEAAQAAALAWVDEQEGKP